MKKSELCRTLIEWYLQYTALHTLGIWTAWFTIYAQPRWQTSNLIGLSLSLEPQPDPMKHWNRGAAINITPDVEAALFQCWVSVVDDGRTLNNIVSTSCFLLASGEPLQTQQTRGIHLMLFQCCFTVLDADPTLKQYRLNAYVDIKSTSGLGLLFAGKWSPANTICWPNAGLMLIHRLWCWPNSNSAFGQFLVFTGMGGH